MERIKKMKENIKILIADDHSLFRAGVIKLLKDHQNIIILGEAENGEELIEKYFELHPDIALADIAMPVMNGPEAISRIKEKDPEVKALFLSMYEGEEYIYNVLKSGGKGLINKSILEDELVMALERINRGEKYFKGDWDDYSLEKLVKEFESGKKLTKNRQDVILSFQEEKILTLLNDGLTSKEIAEELHLSKKTVDYYRASLLKKLNFNSASDLIRFAAQKNQP